MTISGAQRVLIYRLGSLGDTIVALPSLHLIARAFPSAERRMLTNTVEISKTTSSEAVLTNSGLVHGFMTYPAGMRKLSSFWRLRRDIARWRPDILVYLAAPRGRIKAFRDAAFFGLCGIRTIIGVPFSHDRQTVRALDATAFESEANRLARCIKDLGDVRALDVASWDLRLTEDERISGRRLLPASLGGYIAVSPGARVSSKDWGKENWQRLLARLSETTASLGLGLVLIGSKDEYQLCEWVSSGWIGHRVNLCGATNPRIAAAVLSKAVLFLGHDSGPMHLAAAVGTPCVAVFSAQNKPGEWFPHGPQHTVLYHKTDCYGCRHDSCPLIEKICMSSIGVDEVLTATRNHLERHSFDRAC